MSSLCCAEYLEMRIAFIRPYLKQTAVSFVFSYIKTRLLQFLKKLFHIFDDVGVAAAELKKNNPLDRD